MKIGFIHAGNAFLPELEAYTRFFSARGFKISIMNTKTAEKNPTEIEWHFMGTHFQRKNWKSTLIHEYSSASIPPLANFKNLVKRAMNCKPDYRLFLNEYVRNRFSFRDDVPNGTRDMGIPENFQKQNELTKKEFDFVYTGDVSGSRKLASLFYCFTYGKLSKHTLLVLSRNYEKLQKEYAPFRNISFIGPVEHTLVPSYLEKARFAINYIPHKEPFIHQTSTKFLEYAAIQIPIVTNCYAWIKDFERRFGGNFFFLDENLDNFTWENVCGHSYSFPDLAEWKWDKQIEQSGIVEFLQSRIMAKT